MCFLWQYSLLKETTNDRTGFTYNRTYSCKYYNQLNYNELIINLDDQPQVKTLPLTVLFNEAVNFKYYVLSMVERYLTEKTEVLEERSFPSASFAVIKLYVKWHKIETRYSAVGNRRLTAWYVHGTTYITKFQMDTRDQKKH